MEIDAYENSSEQGEEYNNQCEEDVQSTGEDTPDKDFHMILAMTNDGTSDPLMDFSLGMCAIECEIPKEYSIAEIQAEAHQPQTWSTDCQTSHVEDARLMRCKPDRGKAHLIGLQNLTNVIIEGKEFSCLLDSGASCSIVSQTLLEVINPGWKKNLMPINQAKFHSCSDQLNPVGIVEIPLIFPHTRGSVRIVSEFVVMKNARINYLILGNDYLSLYGFDITNSKDRFFSIGMRIRRRSLGSNLI